jgi:hypothetical protein
VLDNRGAGIPTNEFMAMLGELPEVILVILAFLFLNNNG